MKALFTHVVKSIRRSPWQTIFLLFTVFLSAIIFVSIYQVNESVRQENFISAQVKYGEVDVVATADEDGASRYLSVRDVQSVLEEENALADGYFILPVADGEGTLLGAAANLQTIDDFAFFAFEEYRAFAQTEINSTLFVSRAFARERGLLLGQELTVRLLGKEKTYVVRGINAHRFFGEYDLLVNGEGALGVLTGVSPVFSVFDGQNLPCSELLIKAAEGGDVASLTEKINDALLPFGWGATESGGLDSKYFDLVTDVLMGVIFLFSLVVAGMLVGFSLKILSEKRRKETQVFLLSGMPPSKIFLAFCIEVFAVLAVGTLLGIVTAAVFLENMAVGFDYATLGLSVKGGLVCCLAETLVGGVVLFVHGVSSQGRRVPKKRRGRICLCSLLALLIFSVASVILPVRSRWIFAILALFAFLSSLVFGVEPLSRGIARALSPKRKDEGARVRPALTLAAKNNANILEIRNVYRVLCSLLSVVVVVLACVGMCNRQYEATVGYFRCDYIVANANGAVQAIEELENTEGCSSTFYVSASLPDGKKIPLFDTEDISYVGEDLKAEAVPTGNGICLSKVFARLYGLSLGDKIDLTVHHKTYEFVLTGYCGETATVAFIDAKACGFRESLLLVRQKEGTDREEYLTALTETLAAHGAVIQRPNDLFKSRISFAYNFKNLINDYVGLLIPLALLGCFNLVWVSYARRRKQFADFMTVGMTKGDVARMIACEGSIVLVVTLVLSALGGGLLCGLLDAGMQSFGFRLFV